MKTREQIMRRLAGMTLQQVIGLLIVAGCVLVLAVVWLLFQPEGMDSAPFLLTTGFGVYLMRTKRRIF